MKNTAANNLSSLRSAVRSASIAARRKAFRKGLPVGVSKNGKIFLLYKDKKEVLFSPSAKIKRC
jgi:hypothetical protein